MLHFNRKTEYALLAIEHMARKDSQASARQEIVSPADSATVSSAREISDAYQIPYPLLAKVMQMIAGKGLIKSVQGTKGGYVLAKRPTDITVANVVEIFEGPVAVAECFKDEKITCPQWDGCHIKSPFYELNHKIYNLLTQTTVADLTVRKAVS